MYTRFYRKIALATILSMAPILLWAQTLPQDHYWVTDGTVHSIINTGNSVFIGGDFDYVGPNTGLATTVNVSDASVASKFPRIETSLLDGTRNSEVFAVISDGNNGWFIGGYFEMVDGKEHKHLLHVKNDIIDPDFNLQPNGPVYSLALSSDKSTLYIGGDFTAISTHPRQRIAAFTLADEENNVSLAVSPWNPSINGRVKTLALNKDDSIIFLGGEFSSINGESGINGFTALDTASGTRASDWLPSLTTLNANGYVNAITLSDDGNTLYVGGNFETIGSGATQENRKNIAALSTQAPIVVDAWDPNVYDTSMGVDDEVNAIFVHKTEPLAYIAGNFQYAGSTTLAQPYLARLKTDITTNNLDTTWEIRPNGPVNDLAYVYDNRTVNTTDKLYIAGNFSEAIISNSVTQDQPYLFVLNIAETDVIMNTAWRPLATSHINAIHVADNGTVLAVGGKFHSIGGIQQANVARLNITDGAANTTWKPKVNGRVDQIEISADETFLYIAGDFSLVNNLPKNKLARVSTISDIADRWTADIDNGEVRSLALAKLSFDIKKVVVTPKNSNRLYALTEKGLYISNDAGSSWTINNQLNSNELRDIVIAASEPDNIYLSTGDKGVLKSTDAGLSWTPINTGLSSTNVQAIVITNDASRIYASTKHSDPNLTGLFLSENQGLSWTLIANSDTKDIALDALDDNTLYLATPLGIYIVERALNKDKTAYLHTPIDCDTNTTLQIDPCNTGLDSGFNITQIHATTELGEKDSSVLYLISNGMLFRTLNKATLWELLYDATLRRNWDITSISSHANNGARLYASVPGQGVVKSDNSGLTWSRMNNGLTNQIIFNTSIDPNDPNTLYNASALGTIEKYNLVDEVWKETHEGIPNDILYVAGDFFGNHPDYLAAIDTTADGNNPFLNWNPLSAGPINRIKLSKDYSTLYVAGNFNSIGGRAQSNLASLDRSTGNATAWSPIVTSEVLSIDLTDDEQIIYTGLTNAPYINAFRTTTGNTVSDWAPAIDGAVDQIALFNFDHLLAISGNFNNIDGVSRPNLATLLTTPNSGNLPDWKYLTSWQPTPNASSYIPMTFTSSGGNLLLMGGNFHQINQLSRQSFAAYSFTPPTIKASPLGGSYQDSLSVTLDCSDILDCNNVSFFYTKDPDVNTATWSTYSSPINIDTSTSLSIYSSNEEGVRSSISTIQYTIDKTRPSVDIVLPSGKYEYTQTSPLTCSDGDETDDTVSGCSAIFYTLDGSQPSFKTQTTTGTITSNSYDATGTTIKYEEDTPVPIRIDSTLRVIAVDAAGNISREIVGTYRIVRGKGSASIQWPGLFFLAALLLLTYLRQRSQTTPSGK